MNAPVNHVAFGTPAALREFVAECLQMTAFYASMGVNYGEVGDDAGLEVSTRKAAAALRQAISVMAMLKEVNAKSRPEGTAHDG